MTFFVYNNFMRLHFNFEIKEVLYMKKFKRLTACVLLLAMLCGCASNSDTQQNVTFDDYYEATSETQNAKTAHNLVSVAVENKDIVLNPLLATDKQSMSINSLMFESLVEYDQKGSIVPSLATCSVSEDKLSYTFVLKDVYFASGLKLTADDVIFSIKVMCDPLYNGPYDFVNSGITGAVEYNRGEASEIVGLEKISDQTLTIRLDSPNSEFLTLMTFGVLSKNSYSSFAFANIDSFSLLLNNPDGCGQYFLDRQEQDGTIYLKANDKYHKGAPIINNVSIVKADDPAQAVIDGIADIAYVPANQELINTAAQKGNIDMYKLVGNRFVGFGFNCTGTFSDSNTRQAIAYILNAHNTFEQSDLPFAKSLETLQSLNAPSNIKVDAEKFAFSLEKAEELLKSVGYSRDNSGKLYKDGEPFVINILVQSGNSFIETTLNNMKSEIKKLGIELNVEYLTQSEIFQRIQNNQAECFFTTFEFPNSQGALKEMFKTDGKHNIFSFSSTALDKLFDDYKSAVSKEEQSKIAQQILTTLNSQLPVIPIYQLEDLYLVSGKLTDFTANIHSDIFEYMYKLKFE